MAARTIRLSRSSVGIEEQQALAEVIADGYLGMGRFTQLLEAELAAYLGGGREVMCVNTGTAALQLAVQGLGIGAGDEVLVPSLTFVASFQAISATGARPVACDVDAETGFIDAADAGRRITSRTKAIMPVYYASAAPGLADIYDLAKRRGLRVVEDAAHAFGGMRAGYRVGAQGDVVCFSFDGIKNITCGEGGAVVTSDRQVAQRIQDARLLGVEKDTEKRYSGQRSWEFDVHDQGWRYHMSNLMAAVGRVQLHKLPQFAEYRCRLMNRYLEAFANVAGLKMLRLLYADIVPHIFVVRVLGGRRDALMNHLRRMGIECAFHYKPNHWLSKYKTQYSLPGVETLAHELLSLPMQAMLTDEEQQEVVSAVREFLTGSARA